MADLSAIQEALIAGDSGSLASGVKNALDQGTPAGEILNSGLIAAMDIVGDRMQSGDMFIPEVLMSARCMADAVAVLKSRLGDGDASSAGHIVIGTVKGDLHDIGKNLVVMMLESAGFEVTDLGVDVPPETFVKTLEEKNADILALSALLTTTMPMMTQTITALNESGLRDRIKVIVGGAPVNQDFADQVGADGYAPDAGSASRIAKQLCA